MESNSGTTFKTLLSSNVDGFNEIDVVPPIASPALWFCSHLGFSAHLSAAFQPTILPGTPHLHCNNVHPKKCNQCSQNLCATERLPRRTKIFFFLQNLCTNRVELWWTLLSEVNQHSVSHKHEFTESFNFSTPSAGAGRVKIYWFHWSSKISLLVFLSFDWLRRHYCEKALVHYFTNYTFGLKSQAQKYWSYCAEGGIVALFHKHCTIGLIEFWAGGWGFKTQ